jgi:hypothetical protein
MLYSVTGHNPDLLTWSNRVETQHQSISGYRDVISNDHDKFHQLWIERASWEGGEKSRYGEASSEYQIATAEGKANRFMDEAGGIEAQESDPHDLHLAKSLELHRSCGGGGELVSSQHLIESKRHILLHPQDQEDHDFQALADERTTSESTPVRLERR